MHYKKVILYILLSACTTSTLLFSALAQAQRNAPADAGIGPPPPPPRFEGNPPPRPGYAWVPGYWLWNGHHHVWINGLWQRSREGYRPPRPIWQR